MTAVEFPFATRALDSWECHRDPSFTRALDRTGPAPIKISIANEWLNGSAGKSAASPGPSITHPSGGTHRGKLVCTSCGSRSKEGHKFCVFCGSQALVAELNNAPAPSMSTVCTSCGVSCKKNHKFCVFCGTPVKKVLAAGPQPRAAASAHAGVAAGATHVSVAKQQAGGARSAPGDGGGCPARGKMRAYVPAPDSLPATPLAGGLGMKPRDQSTSGAISMRQRKSTLTTLDEGEMEDEEDEEYQEEKKKEWQEQEINEEEEKEEEEEEGVFGV